MPVTHAAPSNKPTHRPAGLPPPSAMIAVPAVPPVPRALTVHLLQARLSGPAAARALEHLGYDGTVTVVTHATNRQEAMAALNEAMHRLPSGGNDIPDVSDSDVSDSDVVDEGDEGDEDPWDRAWSLARSGRPLSAALWKELIGTLPVMDLEDRPEAVRDIGDICCSCVQEGVGIAEALETMGTVVRLLDGTDDWTTSNLIDAGDEEAVEDDLEELRGLLFGGEAPGERDVLVGSMLKALSDVMAAPGARECDWYAAACAFVGRHGQA